MSERSIAVSLTAAVNNSSSPRSPEAGSPAIPKFTDNEVAEAALLTILWHRLSGNDFDDVGYDVSELLGNDSTEIRFLTPLATTSTDIRNELASVFVHYSSSVAGDSENDNTLSLQDFRACLRDAGILPRLSPSSSGGSAAYDEASGQIDVIYTSCVRGAAARHGLLGAVGESKGLTFDTFVWALSRIALWRAPPALKESLQPGDETSIGLTLFHFMCVMAGAKRVSDVGKGDDLLSPDAVAAFRSGAPALERLFLAYSVGEGGPTAHGDGAVVPVQPNLLDMAREFNICPGLISRSKLHKIAFIANPSRTPLMFPAFVEILGRVALVAFSHPAVEAEYPTPGAKIEGLIWRIRCTPAFEKLCEEQRRRGVRLLAAEGLWGSDAAAAGARQLSQHMSTANQLTGHGEAGAEAGDVAEVTDDGLALLSGPAGAGADVSGQDGRQSSAGQAQGQSQAQASLQSSLTDVAAVMARRSPRALAAIRQATEAAVSDAGLAAALEESAAEEGHSRVELLAASAAQLSRSLASPAEQSALTSYLASTAVGGPAPADRKLPERSLLALGGGKAQPGRGSPRGFSTMIMPAASPRGLETPLGSIQSPSLGNTLPWPSNDANAVRDASNAAAAAAAAADEEAKAFLSASGAAEQAQQLQQQAELATSVVLDLIACGSPALVRTGRGRGTGMLSPLGSSIVSPGLRLGRASPSAQSSSVRHVAANSQAQSTAAAAASAAAWTDPDGMTSSVLDGAHAILLAAAQAGEGGQDGHQLLGQARHRLDQGHGLDTSPTMAMKTSSPSSPAVRMALPASPLKHSPAESQSGGAEADASAVTGNSSSILEPDMTVGHVNMTVGSVSSIAGVGGARAGHAAAVARGSHARAPVDVDYTADDGLQLLTGQTGGKSGNVSLSGRSSGRAVVRGTNTTYLRRAASLRRKTGDKAAGMAGFVRANSNNSMASSKAGVPVSASTETASVFGAGAGAAIAGQAAATVGQGSPRGFGSRVGGASAAGFTLGATSLASESARSVVQVVSLGIPTPFPMPGMAALAATKVLTTTTVLSPTGSYKNTPGGLADPNLLADAMASAKSEMRSYRDIAVTRPGPGGAPAGMMGVSPSSPQSARKAKSLPPPPKNLGRARAVHPGIVEALYEGSMHMLSTLRPLFLYYCRINGDAGNTGLMSHRNFLTLLRDLQVIDDRVDVPAVQFQLHVQAGRTRRDAVLPAPLPPASPFRDGGASSAADAAHGDAGSATGSAASSSSSVKPLSPSGESAVHSGTGASSALGPGLTLEGFLEALIRVAELVRHAQEIPAFPGDAPLSPRLRSVSPRKSVFIDGAETKAEAVPSAELKLAQAVSTDFLTRRLMPLLALAGEADAAIAIIDTPETRAIINDENNGGATSNFLKRLFSSYATLPEAADGSKAGAAGEANGPSEDKNDSALHLSALAALATGALARPYLPQFSVLASAWLRMCRDLEIVPGLCSLAEAESSYYAAVRRAGTDGAPTGLMGHKGLAASTAGGAGLRSSRVATSVVHSSKLSAVEASNAAAAGAKTAVPLSRKGIDGGMSRLEPVALTLAHASAKVAGVGPLPCALPQPQAHRAADSAQMAYPAFVEAVCRLALTAFSRPFLGKTYPHAHDKLLGLLGWIQSSRKLRLDVAWGRPVDGRPGGGKESFLSHSQIRAAKRLSRSHGPHAGGGAGGDLGHGAVSDAARREGVMDVLRGFLQESQGQQAHGGAAAAANAQPQARQAQAERRSPGESWAAGLRDGAGAAASAAAPKRKGFTPLSPVPVTGPGASVSAIGANVSDGARELTPLEAAVMVGWALSPSKETREAAAGHGSVAGPGTRAAYPAGSVAASGRASVPGVAVAADDQGRGQSLSRSDLLGSPTPGYPRPYASRRTHRHLVVERSARAQGMAVPQPGVPLAESHMEGNCEGYDAEEENGHGVGQGQGQGQGQAYGGQAYGGQAAGQQGAAGAQPQRQMAAEPYAESATPLQAAASAPPLPQASLFHKGETTHYARILAARGDAAAKAVKTQLRPFDGPVQQAYLVQSQLGRLALASSGTAVGWRMGASMLQRGLLSGLFGVASTAAGADPVKPVTITTDGVVVVKHLASAGPSRAQSAKRRPSSRHGAPGTGSASVSTADRSILQLASEQAKAAAAAGGDADNSLTALEALLRNSDDSGDNGDGGDVSPRAGSTATGVSGGPTVTVSDLSPRGNVRAYHAVNREGAEAAFAAKSASLSVPLRAEVAAAFVHSLRSDTMTRGAAGLSSEFRVQRPGTGTVLHKIDLTQQTSTSIELDEPKAIDPKTVPEPRLWRPVDVLGSPSRRGRIGAVPPTKPLAPVAAGAQAALSQELRPDSSEELARSAALARSKNGDVHVSLGLSSARLDVGGGTGGSTVRAGSTGRGSRVLDSSADNNTNTGLDKSVDKSMSISDLRPPRVQVTTQAPPVPAARPRGRPTRTQALLAASLRPARLVAAAEPARTGQTKAAAPAVATRATSKAGRSASRAKVVVKAGPSGATTRSSTTGSLVTVDLDDGMVVAQRAAVTDSGSQGSGKGPAGQAEGTEAEAGYPLDLVEKTIAEAMAIANAYDAAQAGRAAEVSVDQAAHGRGSPSGPSAKALSSVLGTASTAAVGRATSPTAVTISAARVSAAAVASRSPPPARSSPSGSRGPSRLSPSGQAVPLRYTSPERTGAAASGASRRFTATSPGFGSPGGGISSPNCMGSPGSLLANAGLGMVQAAAAQARLGRLIDRVKAAQADLNVPVTQAAPAPAAVRPPAPPPRSAPAPPAVAAAPQPPQAQAQQMRYRRSDDDDEDGGYEIE